MKYATGLTVKKAQELQAGATININAWVRSKRSSKNVSFVNINDGSTLNGLQVVVANDASGTELQTAVEQVNTGSAVNIQGRLVRSQGNEQSTEILATSIKILGSCPVDEYPLQKKRHSFEFLREISSLRPRTNTIAAVMRVRNTLSMLTHQFFQEQGFFYVHTPIITSSDAEGAGDLFRVSVQPSTEQEFFGTASYLTVSGQLEGESYAMAMRNIYTFGPTFRAEYSNTSRHLSEFWMIEPELAFCDINGIMDLAEDYIKYLINGVLAANNEDLSFFDKWIEAGLLDSLEQIVSNDFARITYSEAVEQLRQAKTKFEHPLNWDTGLQTEHERYLTEKIYKKPVLVTDYPAHDKAFYMKVNADKKTVRGMDLLVPRMGEIIGGSERESDYSVLQQRMLEANVKLESYEWYLNLRRFGGTPHAGFGLGFERMIQYVTGMKNIRDVIPFPRAPGQVF